MLAAIKSVEEECDQTVFWVPYIRSAMRIQNSWRSSYLCLGSRHCWDGSTSGATVTEELTTHYACAMKSSMIGDEEAGSINLLIERLTATVLILARRCVQVEYDTRLAAESRQKKRRRPRLTAEIAKMTAESEKASQPAAGSRDGPRYLGGGEERRATRG